MNESKQLSSPVTSPFIFSLQSITLSFPVLLPVVYLKWPQTWNLCGLCDYLNQYNMIEVMLCQSLGGGFKRLAISTSCLLNSQPGAAE